MLVQKIGSSLPTTPPQRWM